jgi:HEAT repeat protein
MGNHEARKALNELESAFDTISENLWRVQLADLAEDDPEQLIPKLSELVDLLSAAEMLDRNTAAGVIGHIAYEYPAEVEPYLADIAEHLDESHPGTKQNLLLIFDGISDANSEAVKPFIHDIIEQIDHENLGVRTYAAVVVSNMPEIIEDKSVIGDLLYLLLEDVLSEGNMTNLHNVTHSFDQLSKSDPTACIQATSTLLPLLDSDHAGVRMNVARTLGNMEIVGARDALKDLLDDDDGDVRQAAQAALENIPKTQAERSVESQEKIGGDSDISRSETKKQKSTSESTLGQNRLDTYSERKQKLRRSLVRGL